MIDAEIATKDIELREITRKAEALRKKNTSLEQKIEQFGRSNVGTVFFFIIIIFQNSIIYIKK